MEGPAVIARRSFLAGILAAGSAPAIARAESLMRVVPVRHQAPWFAAIGPDASKVWEDALRGACVDGLGWVRVGVDPVLDDRLGLSLIRGEIGRIDGQVRIVVSQMHSDLVREWRDELERKPVGRSDFLGEFLNREVDLAPRPPRFSADSVGRKRYRW
jgi:hypothetical protein